MQRNKMVKRAQLKGARRRKVNIFKKTVTPSFKITGRKKGDSSVQPKLRGRKEHL